MNIKSLMDISDWDLQWIARNELCLLDNELLDIERNQLSVTIFWRGVHRKGSIVVMNKAICIISGDKILYLTEKSVDYLKKRGYEICDGFVYMQDARFVV